MASSVPIRSSPPRTKPFLELVPHGELTPKLWTLRVGDAVSLRRRPKGVFTLEEKFPVHLLVATVTGIAPFVSMLRSAHAASAASASLSSRGELPRRV